MFRNIALPDNNLSLCMLKPLRTIHREITRGLCLICAEEMTSEFRGGCKHQQQPAEGNKTLSFMCCCAESQHNMFIFAAF